MSEIAKLVERLRGTTQEMASTCSVPMELWDRHSNAVLEAATRIEDLTRRVGEHAEVVSDLKHALTRLMAVVRGECPSLLDEDDGGTPPQIYCEEAIRRARSALGETK